MIIKQLIFKILISKNIFKKLNEFTNNKIINFKVNSSLNCNIILFKI